MYQKTHSKSLSQLINEIETLRIRRQDQYRHYPSPQLKVFSQQELNDAACPSYKNYLNGRTRKVLSREAILSIAEYLECTLQQINELLLCAGYLPIATDPDGIALDMRLEEGRATLQLLSFPAVLSTRDWRVKGTNSLYTSFWNVPAWEQTPSDKQHNLHLLFHADFAGRRPLQTRTQTLHGALSAFYTHNKLFVHDSWFQQFVDLGNQYHDFKQLWQSVTSTPADFQNVGEVFIAQTNFIYRFRFLHMSIGQQLYPVITTFIPLDETARQLLATFDSHAHSCHLET